MPSRKPPRAAGDRAGPSALPRHRSPSKPELRALVVEATIDCYGESEQVTGLYTMMEEALALPFRTSVLGVEVTVEKLDLTDAGEIVVVCRRQRVRQRISVLELHLPDPPPAWSAVD